MNKYVFDTNALIDPVEIITVCTDPKDNKFLELAIACKAKCIVSGDSHLLDLHPFRSIPIINAADFILEAHS